MGNVVTARIITLTATDLVELTLVSGETIAGTPLHPIWSVEAQDWIELGAMQPGDAVWTEAGPVEVASTSLRSTAETVYNIEVHGNHIYQIGDAGVLVHNATPGDYRKWGKYYATGNTPSKNLGRSLRKRGLGRPNAATGAAHIVPTSIFANARHITAEAKAAIKLAQSAFDKTLGAAARNKAVNGFWAESGHLGTHSNDYFIRMGELLGSQTTARGMGLAIQQLRSEIRAGRFIQ